MAKRKKPQAERQRVRQHRKDERLLRRYAVHCYQWARVDKAKESGLPLSSFVPAEGRRHEEIIRLTERELATWFSSLGPGYKARARAKIEDEMAARPMYTRAEDAPKPTPKVKGHPLEAMAIVDEPKELAAVPSSTPRPPLTMEAIEEASRRIVEAQNYTDADHAFAIEDHARVRAECKKRFPEE